MNLRPEEISKVIQAQIKNYNKVLDVSEVGTVITVGDGIALIHGLEKAMASELLLLYSCQNPLILLLHGPPLN